MQITVALDGSLVRNLRLSPGDEVTIDLTVYESDGDASPLAYTNPEMTVGTGDSYPIDTEFTIPLDLGRTPYQLTVEISGATTTVAYGFIETSMPGSCSIVVCCTPGGSGSGGSTFYQPLDDALTQISDLADPNADRILFFDDSADEIAYLTLGTNLSITGDTINAASGAGDVVGPASAVNNRVAFFDGTTGKLIKDGGVTLSGSNTGDQTSIVGITGTIAQFNTACSDADFATGGGTATGTNTGDQTTIAGITGTLAQFNTALTGADFASGGGTATGTNTGDQTTIVGITGSVSDFNTALTGGDFLTTAAAVTAAQGGTGLNTLTANNVVLGNGTGNVLFVAPSTSGNVLTSNGTTWTSAAAGGGGSWIYLSTVSASAASTADIETTFNSTYDVYCIVCTGVVFSAATGDVGLRLKVGGAYDAGSNYFTWGGKPSSGSSGIGTANAAGGGTSLVLNAGSNSSTSSDPLNLNIYVYNPSSTALRKGVHWDGVQYGDSATVYRLFGGGFNSATTALTGVRMFPSSGTLTGTFRLYGIKNS